MGGRIILEVIEKLVDELFAGIVPDRCRGLLRRWSFGGRGLSFGRGCGMLCLGCRDCLNGRRGRRCCFGRSG